MAVTNRKKNAPVKKDPKTETEKEDVVAGVKENAADKDTLKEVTKMAIYAAIIAAMKAVIKFAYPGNASYDWQLNLGITWAILMAAQILLYLSNQFSKQGKSSGLVGGLACVGAGLGYHAISQR
ncbi:hypothetical protein CJU90_4116 [Yarrowia sp. C11]|nr:hypothetical protein CKK34_5725 [Yarrowia sp. E02]KAG5367807.1 hypothetical protein CJU90_4116 [Yarrowia sp. C11]